MSSTASPCRRSIPSGACRTWSSPRTWAGPPTRCTSNSPMRRPTSCLPTWTDAKCRASWSATNLMTAFRILVVLAFLFHVIALFLIPHLGFVIAHHWLLYALYLMPYVALVAIWFAQAWGRWLLLAYLVVIAGISFFAGISVTPPEAFLSLMTAVLDGAVLSLAFFGSRA